MLFFLSHMYAYVLQGGARSPLTSHEWLICFEIMEIIVTYGYYTLYCVIRR